MTPQDREAIEDIGGQRLAEHTEFLVKAAKVLPHAHFPPKEVMERDRIRLRKALARVRPEVRLLLRTLHLLNSRHYGYTCPPDIVGYLDALLAVKYVKPKGDPLRHEVVFLTHLTWVDLGLELSPARDGDLHEYISILTRLLGQTWDVHQLAREVCGT